MQYAVDYSKDSAPTHLVKPYQTTRVVEDGQWQFRSSTACGKTVIGAMGWAGHPEFITCAACRRTRQFKEG